MICITPVLFGYNDQNYVNSPQKLEESVSIFDENDDGDIITEEKTDEVNIGGLSEVLLKGFGIFTNNQSKSKHDPTVDDFNINEKIEYSEQGEIGDCWLLSGLNALSYSKKGRKLIEEAITTKSDCFEVTFKGVNTTVTITPKEMRAAKKSDEYSCGDDDVLLMELACEKVMDDIKYGRISAPKFLSEDAKDGETSIDCGCLDDLIYLLNGEKTSYQYNCFHPDCDDFVSSFQQSAQWLAKLLGNSMENVYDKIEKNPEKIVATISFRGKEGSKGKIVIKDVKGNDVVLTHGDTGHLWSIKAVNGNKVVIVNPWDSSEEVVVSKSEIKKYAKGITYFEW